MDQVPPQLLQAKLDSKTLQLELAALKKSADFTLNPELDHPPTDLSSKIDRLQAESGPTYQHSPAYNPTLLDLLIVNNKEKVINFGQISDHGISKHDLIFLSYSVKVPKFSPKLITARNMKGTNWVDDLLLELENKINNLYDNQAPYRTFRVTKKSIPWITDNIIKHMKIRDNLKRSNNSDHWKMEKPMARRLVYPLL
ncbi:hypothetical protein B566_EDAN004498 [Ephemera danica]|nr:hypothetical protein B566_EDAN004498 [Ephemera danica]